MSLDNYKRRVSHMDASARLLVERQMEILDRIHELLENKFHGNQKALASQLQVSEAQVSKMIAGLQNFTLKSIVNLESAFGASIIRVVCDPSHDQADVGYFVQSGHSVPMVIDEHGNLSSKLSDNKPSIT